MAFVWGTIIYKVITGLKNKDTIISNNTKSPKFNYTTPEDSFTLIANYPDPFLHNDTTSFENDPRDGINDAALATQPILPIKPSFDLTKIQYHGMIVNPEKKKKVAIISIAGKEYMAKEKERIDDIFISRITKEKITVLINGKVEQVIKQVN